MPFSFIASPGRAGARSQRCEILAYYKSRRESFPDGSVSFCVALQPEKFVVGSEANQFDGACSLVKPYQKVITTNMTFHTTFIGPMQFMRFTVSGDGLAIFQQLENIVERFQFLRLVHIFAIVFLELGAINKFFHPSMDFVIASMLLVSTLGSSTPERHSSIAARVSALGR